jgi:hypothetical protein
MGRSRSSSESSKETYDPFWPHAYTFLEDLEANFAVPLDKARIGSLVKFEALIQFVDLKLLRNFWEPSVRAFLSSSPKPPTRQQKRHQERRGQGASQSLSPEMENVIQVLQSMPHLFHMTFVTESGIALWAAVQPSNLTINSEDLAMKFGAAMDGIWTVVGILDGQPGEPAKPIPLGSAMLDLAVEAMANLRTVVGRPKTHLGLTPIAIYAPLIGMAEITAEPLESNSPPPS